jgi:alkyldihydroxyacetonephosphate synthase
MKRWNGWGSDSIALPVPSPAQDYLGEMIGPSHPGPSVDIKKIIRRVPKSGLPHHRLVSRDPELRLRCARGHSLPDWISLRFGSVDRFPEGVALPISEEDVEEIVAWAKERDFWLIPYGGGTSVVGHINPPDEPGARPVLTVSLEKMRRMISVNEESRLANFEAGVTGPHLEAQLRARGYTLGHFPQSFEFSTLGGWVATRSAGQQSLYYGRIEDLFAGGRMIAPAGRLDLPPFPASAAGPDLRQAVLGSEGRLGIITQAYMRVRPLPAWEKFHAVFFPNWSQGIEAVKEMAQTRLPLSMLRLSNSLETSTSLILAGSEMLVRLLNRLLRVRGLKDDKCLLFMGFTGDENRAKNARRAALDCARAHGGVHAGRKMGSEWRKSRFLTPYLRNSLWDLGYAVDTLETALTWSELARGTEAVLTALRQELEGQGERVLAFAHVSHVYATGASIYVTYLFRLAGTAEETLSRWKKLKKSASAAIVARGGTISHQHGIGFDHLPWLEAEKGRLGLEAMSALARTFDPGRIMNPGKLIPGG